MINNITTMDTRPQMAVAKPMQSVTSMGMPPILGFKSPPLKEKAEVKLKKIKRADKIIIPGVIDDDYVDIVEEAIDLDSGTIINNNFFLAKSYMHPTIKREIKYLKNCYIIDYIQSPKQRCGLGTEAIKQVVEKAFFDKKAEGRIVTFSAPLIKEASPAMFFYKLGFRFVTPEQNDYMEECLKQKIPDIPAQIGMMYLPKARVHKLLTYGDLY